MLSIGWPEMMVVAAAALIIVGPRDLPALLRTIGQMTGKLRRMSNEFRSELNKVAALDDVKEIRKSITAPLVKSRAEIEGEFNKISAKGVEPSGKLKPTDPKVESVYDAIKAQTGEIKNPDHEAANASMKAAIAQSTAKSDVVAKPEAEAATKSAKKPAAPKKPAAAKPSAVKPPAAKAAKSAAPKPQAAKKPAAKAPAKPKAQTTAKPKSPAKSTSPKTPRAATRKQTAGKA